MNKVLVLLAAVASFATVGLSGSKTALAIPPFYKEFEAKYVKPGEPLEAEVARVKKCNVCHKGTDKKTRNAYGEALAVLLDKKADAKDTAKIQKSLDEVAAQNVKADDPSSPTFGDLLKEGKLPSEE